VSSVASRLHDSMPARAELSSTRALALVKKLLAIKLRT
jgi:hypothetical protein